MRSCPAYVFDVHRFQWQAHKHVEGRAISPIEIKALAKQILDSGHGAGMDGADEDELAMRLVSILDFKSLPERRDEAVDQLGGRAAILKTPGRELEAADRGGRSDQAVIFIERRRGKQTRVGHWVGTGSAASYPNAMASGSSRQSHSQPG